LGYFTEYSLVVLGKIESWDLAKVSSYVLPKHIIGVLLAPIIYWIYNRYKNHEFRSVWKHLLLYSLLLGLLYGFLNRTFWIVHSYLIIGVENDVTFVDSIKKHYRFLIPAAIPGIVNFWAMTILFFALDFYDQFKNQSFRSIQLEAQLNDTKLQNLRMQLNPHFLFNALNTVSMMVRKDKKSNAINMISGVSDLLRSSLNIGDAHFITLKEEIQLLKKYLHIEEQRFHDRLTIEFDISEEVWSLKVPNLLLQPLVENAFKYGVSNNINEAYIKISAREDNGRCHIEIYNKGNLLPEPLKEGIGLKNTKSRLAMSFSTYSFILTNAKDLSGVIAIIGIPITYD